MITNRFAKAKATKEAKKAKFQSQSVQIDKDWRIIRADELNWEVQYKGKFNGYYGSLLGAMHSLPSKMLDEEAGKNVQNLIKVAESVGDRIDLALSGK